MGRPKKTKIILDKNNNHLNKIPTLFYHYFINLSDEINNY